MIDKLTVSQMRNECAIDKIECGKKQLKLIKMRQYIRTHE